MRRVSGQSRLAQDLRRHPKDDPTGIPPESTGAGTRTATTAADAGEESPAAAVHEPGTPGTFRDPRHVVPDRPPPERGELQNGLVPEDHRVRPAHRRCPGGDVGIEHGGIVGGAAAATTTTTTTTTTTMTTVRDLTMITTTTTTTTRVLISNL